MKNTLLLVDDDPLILQITSRLLGVLGFTHVLKARCATEALRIWQDHKYEIGILLTDINLPGMSGDELAAELHEADPHLELFFMSGVQPDCYTSKIPLHPGLNFLQKPFTPQQLEHLLLPARPPTFSDKKLPFYAFAV